MRETAHFRGAAVGHALYARIRSDRTGRPDCIRPYRTRARTCRAVDLRLELRRETGQRQRTEREPDVPQRDVEVPRDEQQVENDAPQPRRDDVSPDARFQRDERPDILVNVAGAIEVGPLPALTSADWHEAMAVNFWGPLHAMLAAAPRMRARGAGRIARPFVPSARKNGLSSATTGDPVTLIVRAMPDSLSMV